MIEKALGRHKRQRHSFGFFWLAIVLLGGCATLKQCAYEGLSRDEWQQPDRVIQSLQIRPGDTVADLGAGSGYFTFRLARAAGSTGKVYAVDIDEDMTEVLAQKAKKQNAANVEVILAKPEDPLLPDGSIDLIFTSNTYHHIGDRVRYFAALGKALRRGGRLAVIEYDRRSWSAGLLKHYTPSEFIKREMEQAGYRLARELDFLDRQSFLLFELRERANSQGRNG
ncbi:MAG: methyltransferase domain-containing protein [Deltaproteobacteria bacterium]|nr:methyltransferase domain-containing protein [Deltaproteobacteria bacterium]